MSSALGELAVQLSCATAQFNDAITKSAYLLEQQTLRMTRSTTQFDAAFTKLGRSALNVAATMGISLSAISFVRLITGTIEAQAHLENLARSANISVESMGGLGFAATQTGGDVDSMALAFKKFNQNISAAAAGSAREQEVFRALNISLKDLQTLKPDQIFIKAANAFASFDESADKATLGAAAFGRGYQGILPTLDQGGKRLQENIEYFRRFGGVTEETARAASAFETEMQKIHLLSGAFARNLTADLLPGMRALASALLEAKEKGDQFSGWAQKAADFITETAVETAYLVHWMDNLRVAIENASARMDRWMHLDFAGARLIAEGEPAKIDEANRKFDALIANIRKATSDYSIGFHSDATPDPKRGPAPRLSVAGAAVDPMVGWENVLKAARDSYNKLKVQQGSYELWSITETRDYWDEVLSMAGLSAKTRLEVENKYYDAAAQVLQKEGELRARLAEIAARREESAATFANAMGRSNLDQMVALRQISDAQMFAGQKALEDALYSLKRDALEKELAISGLKLDKVAELNAAIEALEQQHQLTLTQIDHAAVLERSKDAIAAADAMQAAFATFLTDLAGRTMTISQAFTKMANSIVASLNKIAADAIAKQLLGAGTSGGNWLGSLMGMIFPSSSGAGIGYGTAGSAIPAGPFPYAEGTDFARGGLSLVGEHGPEIVNLPRGAQVIPNHAIRGQVGGHTMVNHISIGITGNVTRATMDQMAMELISRLERAQRSYG